MPRFLSAEWFAAARAEPAQPSEATVIEQVVHDAPEGTVVYRVAVREPGPTIVWPVPADAPDADLRITSAWPTAVAIASGELSTHRALMEGLLRVKGDANRLAGRQADLGKADPISAELRRETTFA